MGEAGRGQPDPALTRPGVDLSAAFEETLSLDVARGEDSDHDEYHDEDHAGHILWIHLVPPKALTLSIAGHRLCQTGITRLCVGAQDRIRFLPRQADESLPILMLRACQG